MGNPIECGGNLDHVTLGLELGLRLTFHVVSGRTVSRLCEDYQLQYVYQSYIATLDMFYPNVCLIVIKENCWDLVEVCALLSALLVLFYFLFC